MRSDRIQSSSKMKIHQLIRNRTKKQRTTKKR